MNVVVLGPKFWKKFAKQNSVTNAALLLSLRGWYAKPYCSVSPLPLYVVMGRTMMQKSAVSTVKPMS